MGQSPTGTGTARSNRRLESRPMSSSGAVLGIDVGWSQKKKSSAVCHLSWSNVSVRWKAKTFAAGTEQRRSTILDVAGDRELLAVAIDGPIRPDLETVDKYRAAERVLSRGELLRRIGKPGQSSSPNGEKLNEQANLAARVLEESCRVIEATHAVPVRWPTRQSLRHSLPVFSELRSMSHRRKNRTPTHSSSKRHPAISGMSCCGSSSRAGRGRRARVKSPTMTSGLLLCAR